MKRNIKNNLSSKDEFRLYSDNKMNPEQKADFLRQMEKDEFSKEAIQGFEEFSGSFQDVDFIDKKIHSVSPENNYKFKKRDFFTFVTPIILISVISFFIIYNKVQKEKINNETATFINDSHKINIEKREIENAELIAESRQITSVKAKDEQKKVEIFEKNMPVEFIEKLHLITAPENISNENINPGIDAHYNYMQTTYMYDFKVINYSGIYRNKVKKIIPDGGSLAPRYENLQNSHFSLTSEDNFTYIGYNDFLNDAMGKFSVNNFKEALQDYNIILQQYPDDLNAHFYGGLSYYNIGLNQKAIEFFDAVLDNNAITFIQEALWYKALSLINAGNKKEADILLQKIVDAKGFYASRAKETLLIINN